MQCMKNPVPIGVGYLAQYIIKPLLGFAIAKVRPRSHIIYVVILTMMLNLAGLAAVLSDAPAQSASEQPSQFAVR